MNNLIIILFSSVLSLFSAEFIFRLYNQSRIFLDVEMARYSYQLKTISSNPKIGFVHKKNQETKLMGVKVRTNSQGLRDKEYSFERNSKKRWIFLGDSLTFAWGVEKERSFESILEKELGHEIINFAHGNYNTQQEVEYFHDNWKKYSPDKVVLFYFLNDAEKMQIQTNWGLLSHSQLFTFIWSRIRSTKGSSYNDYYKKVYSNQYNGLKEVDNAFSKLSKIAKDNNIQVQVVLLPDFYNLAAPQFFKEYALVSKLLEKHNIEYYDLANDFIGVKNPKNLWVSLDDPHPNEIAHKMIAKFIKRFIDKDE
jgi:lysophospholipase L1-like esterase